MSKYYLIARRRDNSYTTIDINDGKKLEDIDIYTTAFYNKKELLKDLEKHGLDTSDGVDLFIANYSKQINKVRTRRVLYKTVCNPELLNNVKKSLNGEDVDTERVYRQAATMDEDYKTLVLIGYFDTYKGFDKIIYNKGKKLSYSDENKWLENDYNNYRDALASLLIYKNLNINNKEDYQRVLENGNKLRAQRKEILENLAKTLNKPLPGQTSFLINDDEGKKSLSVSSSNNNFIHIKNINFYNIREKTSISKKKPNGLVKTEDGQIYINDLLISNDKKIDLNTFLMDSINFTDTSREDAEKHIFKFLTNDTYFKKGYIKEENKDVHLNYEKLPFDLNQQDKKKLESLKSSKVLFRVVNEYHRYGNDYYPSSSALEDKAACSNEIKTRLSNLSLSSINNVARFCVLYKDCYDRAIRKEGVKDGHHK